MTEPEAWEDRCRDCDDTGITIQTERRCACQPPLPKEPAMTSKLDPQELERLSKAATQGVWEISAYYTGTGPDEKCCGLVEVEDFPIGIIDEEGATAESLSPNLEFVTTLVNAYRTGQLVPAMPSGDVVEAVARGLYEEDDPWSKAWPWPNLQPDQGSPDAYRRLATAAITTYEAVSGVAKMRDALRPFAAMAAAYDPDDGDGDLWAFASRPTIGQVRAARAALGEKP